jgi:hypothetical protein
MIRALLKMGVQGCLLPQLLSRPSIVRWLRVREKKFIAARLLVRGWFEAFHENQRCLTGETPFLSLYFLLSAAKGRSMGQRSLPPVIRRSLVRQRSGATLLWPRQHWA